MVTPDFVSLKKPTNSYFNMHITIRTIQVLPEPTNNFNIMSTFSRLRFGFQVPDLTWLKPDP